MLRKSLWGVISLILLSALALFAYVQWSKSPPVFEPSVAGLYNTQVKQADSQSLRNTRSGEVVGIADNYDTYAWLGIPYAAPPVDSLRWRAPRAPANWSDIRSATEYGAPCLQFWRTITGVAGQDGDVAGSEDCLSLNIWAPKSNSSASAAKVPVMVWIHGGGNDSGSARLFQAHHLSGSQKVVVVTINYRLGLLGWFSHAAIRDSAGNPEDASGNYGTLDIIAALQWVQRNIAEFGGDPTNVTIFGESAGGRNVYSMIASPLAKGLFHRAIAQSGTVDTTLRTLAEDFPDEVNTKAISGLKSSSSAVIEAVLKAHYPKETSAQIRDRFSSMPSAEILALLQQQDAEQFSRLALKQTGTNGYIQAANVIRDGYVIPEASLLTLFTDPNGYNRVPLMIGSNRDEQKLFMARNLEYVDLLFGILPQIKDEARYQRVSDYVSNNWKAGAVDEPAKVINANGGSPVFAYRFDWDESASNLLFDLPSVLGAAHGMEINFIFGDFTGGVPFDITYTRDNAPSRRDLSLAMMSYWAEFAYSGAPNSGRNGLNPAWQAWQSSGDNLLLLDGKADGGVRMTELRTNVADIKTRLASDDVLSEQHDRCRAYAALFLHGYQTSDFWDAREYNNLGCSDYPVGSFREG